MKALDIQYADLRPDRCLARKVGLETLISDDDVRMAMTQPPTTTRAYFRGRCLQKWPDDIVAANWDSMVFDIGRDPQLLLCRDGHAIAIDVEPLTGYDGEIRHLIDCLTTDRRPAVNLRDAATTHAVLDAVRRSIECGESIRLAEELAEAQSQ